MSTPQLNIDELLQSPIVRQRLAAALAGAATPSPKPPSPSPVKAVRQTPKQKKLAATSDLGYVVHDRRIIPIRKTSTNRNGWVDCIGEDNISFSIRGSLILSEDYFDGFVCPTFDKVPDTVPDRVCSDNGVEPVPQGVHPAPARVGEATAHPTPHRSLSLELGSEL